MTVVEGFVGIEFKTTCSNSDEPEDRFLTRFEGVILAQDENEQDCQVGYCKATQIRLDAALNAGYSYFDLFDVEGSLLEIAETLMEDLSDFSNDLYEKYVDHVPNITGLLIIDRVEILPQYRGNSYGLLTLKLILSHLAFGSECLAVLKAYPLQFENQDLKDSLSEESRKALGNFSCNLDEGRQKLVKYYSKAGFELFNSDSVMVKPLGF